MARLLQQIEWGAPLLPVQPDELVRRMSPWLADTIGSFSEPMKFSYATPGLMAIAYFVTSQENACRYCYGVSRAMMQVWGYSDREILDLEQEATLADGQTRRVVEFARKLARSNPLPAREDREALLANGLRPEAVSEIAACVVEACFANRVATFLALPPNLAIERIPTTPLGRLLAPFYRRKLIPRKAPPPVGLINEGPCAPIIAAAGSTQLALWLRTTTNGCMSSSVLPRRSKELMLAVIARQLGSRLCEDETRASLEAQGFSDSDTQDVLSTLGSPALTSTEERLLRWTRETVWYEPRVIQISTRRMLEELGESLTLEAVGAAALCNTLARLSLVRQ